jgi:methionyl-tRNA synthetase
MARKTLITSALPYANGPLHLGHMVEYVQTDIYVRFLRSCGEDVVYLCADDTHGTPIELNAAKQGLSPEAFIQGFFEQHQADLKDFDVGLDYFGSTNAPENRQYAELIYERLKAAGDIDRREIEQTYCEKDKRFLPDRFIRGTCPNCKSADQYGDVCEVCGKTYSPTDLIEPKCALCGSTPIRKKSTHLFFRLSKHEGFLKDQLKTPGFLNPAVANQLQQFFEKGLSDWDISRDGPYFGFPIPGETNTFFYVWLDAPIGYISTTERWAKATGKATDALAYWAEDADARVLHFIGKDIVYFHALFWPAVLKVAKLKRPERVLVHGHLTVNGQKMSKSRGTLISARTYLEKLDPSYLRYFYAANLGPGAEDFDLSLSDFRLRVNGELVNNIGNLANRALSLLAGPLEGRLAPAASGSGKALVEEAIARVPEVRAAYEKLELRQVVRVVTEVAQAANQFVQAQAPWAKLKTDVEGARADLTQVAEVVYLVAGLLSPIVPRLTQKLFEQLGQAPLQLKDLVPQGDGKPAISVGNRILLDRTRPLGTPSPLIARLEAEPVDALVKPLEAAPAKSPAAPSAGAAQKPAGKEPAAAAEAAPSEIEYSDFAKVQLKVGKVLAAERVPGADKLLKLSVDVGEGGPRTIAAGIAEAYAPENLVGRNVVVVANLKPRVLRKIESRGMLLASGPGGKSLSLVDPGDFPPGTEVK